MHAQSGLRFPPRLSPWLLMFAGCWGCSARDGAPTALSDASEESSPDAQGEAAGACIPTSISGFAPPPFNGVHARSLACEGLGGDGGLVQALGDACFGPMATYAACASFAAPEDAGACLDCLLPLGVVDGGPGGVVAKVENAPVVNYSACIALVDPQMGPACASAIYRATACAAFACRSCPVTDGDSLSAFLACTDAAATGACFGLHIAALACVAAEEGDGGTAVAVTCFPGPHIEDNYLSFAHELCGD
jgi:hypothetical protein